MSIYLMYALILIISLIIIKLIKNKEKAQRLLGIITILSSIIILFLILVVSIILKNNINYFNISIISNYFLKQYTKNSLYIILIGIIELILSKYVLKKL